MSSSAAIAEEPLFVLFVIASFVLSLGYFWGRRRNLRLARQVFDAMRAVMQPVDELYTNIGGLTGFHASFKLPEGSAIQRADMTLTLLARQAMLYYPFSRLGGRRDRLFVTLKVDEDKTKGLSEGHLVERDYDRHGSPLLAGKDGLVKEEIRWAEKRFVRYAGSEGVKEALQELPKMLPSPGSLRHLAVVPQQSRFYIFVMPSDLRIASFMPILYRWCRKQVG